MSHVYPLLCGTCKQLMKQTYDESRDWIIYSCQACQLPRYEMPVKYYFRQWPEAYPPGYPEKALDQNKEGT